MNKHRALSLLPSLLLLGFTAEDSPEAPPRINHPSATIGDIVAEAPEYASVLLENEAVRTVLFRLQPGDELPEHAGRQRVVYALTDYQILFTEDGETRKKDWQAGQAHWHEAVNHAIRNIGDSEARFLVVARKPPELPEASHDEHSHDAVDVDGGFADLVLENDNVRVSRVSLPPGASQAEHHGLHRLIYSLSDYSIRYTSDRIGNVEHSFARGDAHWHQPDIHAVENIGTTTAEFAIFQFKK